jgi:hypothetical protein
MRNATFLAVICAIVTILFPQLAQAYVGPGAGLSAIGAALALIGGLALAVIGFVWYPLKRLVRGNQQRRGKSGTSTDSVLPGPAKSESVGRPKR